jgi:hypothetical protein
VLGVSWYVAAPGGKSDRAVTQKAAPQTAKADLDALTARIAKVETRPSDPATATPDPALRTQIETLEKSVASLRDDLASARSSIDSMKSAPRDSAAPDLSNVEERISKIERATVALTGEIATPKQDKAQDQPQAKPPEDDTRLRLVAAATTLDTTVHQGEPYAASLVAVRVIAGDLPMLKPLDMFAEKGVPSAKALCQELLILLPQLALKPTTPAPATSLLERLKQSASNMVRIERTDQPRSNTPAIVARIAAAAQRDDLTGARQEINALPSASRAPLASWIEKADARQAALAASKQFASDMAAPLAKPAR